MPSDWLYMQTHLLTGLEDGMALVLAYRGFQWLVVIGALGVFGFVAVAIWRRVAGG